jgi:hypothetical protein
MTYYAGYQIECEECGTRNACWVIDAPSKGESLQKEVKMAWNKQKEQVTDQKHADHTWEYTKKLKYGSKADFKKMFDGGLA